MKITLTEADRLLLERWVKSRSVGDKQWLRARMVLMTADGLSTTAIINILTSIAPCRFIVDTAIIASPPFCAGANIVSHCLVL
jgi:hypothetical protein